MLRQDGDKLFLQCSILPGSKQDTITGRVGDALKIKLRATPTEGKANKALIRFLARQCRVPPSSIRIVRGELSRHKTLCLDGVGSIPACLQAYLD